MALKGRRRIWTIPNCISLFRLLLIPLLVSLYWKGRTGAALAVFAVSAASDVADGPIARRFDMVSDLGKMLDPLADKLTLGAAALCAARTHPQLYLLLGFMALKELFQAIIGGRVVRRTGHVFSSQWFGKLCTVITTACLMALFAFPGLPEKAVNGMLILCGLLMAGSLVLYARHFHAYGGAAQEEGRATA